MMKVHTIPVTPFMQNCRVIVCNETNKAALVDPGGDPEKIAAFVDSLGVEVEKILLTHGHLDHVGASVVLKNKYNVEIVGPHKDEQFWFDALPMQCQMFGFPIMEPFLPDTWLEEGDKVAVGKIDLSVFLCPGHTPGHVVFYNKPSSSVFVGDVLFQGSIGRTDFPKGDGPTLLNSIREKLFTLPDETVVLSGHGNETTIGIEKRTNPFVSGRFG